MPPTDRLYALQQLPVEVIRDYRKNLTSDVIPADLQRYILQLDCVARITHTNNYSVRAATDALQREFPELTPAAARGIYYDALEYFHFDDRLSCAVWDAVYAEQLENLKTLAIANNKLDVAYKCICKARAFRTTQREPTEVDRRPPVFIINMTVRPEDLGFKSQKLLDIARRNEDAQFEKMIGSLPIPDADKNRLRGDAGIILSTGVVTSSEPVDPEEEED